MLRKLLLAISQQEVCTCDSVRTIPISQTNYTLEVSIKCLQVMWVLGFGELGCNFCF